jgi:hypothetical protein
VASTGLAGAAGGAFTASVLLAVLAGSVLTGDPVGSFFFGMNIPLNCLMNFKARQTVWPVLYCVESNPNLKQSPSHKQLKRRKIAASSLNLAHLFACSAMIIRSIPLMVTI